MPSLAEFVASQDERTKSDLIDGLSSEEYASLYFNWEFWARENQIPEDTAWTTWLIMAGRGWGKTRCGAEWVRARVESGNAKRIALVGETAADVRDVMVEGESGLMSICPPWNKPTYAPARRRLTWPNGAMAFTYSGDTPDQLRGPQHDTAWSDEPAKWRYGEEAYANILLGLRLGDNPQHVATTTPRPIPLVKELIKDPRTLVTTGSTFENIKNLAPTFQQAILDKYEDTRLGRQEIYAEILDDAPGALWSQAAIDEQRISRPPELSRVVVAIDPAASASEESDETGIIVAALGRDGKGYVLDDRSGRYSPQEWARYAIALGQEWEADRIIAEVNQGGDMVEQVLRTVQPNVSYRAVRASRGKVSRAEPVSALYEQKRVFHCGRFPELETQMSSFEPEISRWSPDRMDALVYALTDLMLHTPRELTIKKVLS